MANYDSNYAIAQEISARIGASPIPFDSVYSICLEIYKELGGTEIGFDSVYSILLEILPIVQNGVNAIIDVDALPDANANKNKFVRLASDNKVYVSEAQIIQTGSHEEIAPDSQQVGNAKIKVFNGYVYYTGEAFSIYDELEERRYNGYKWNDGNGGEDYLTTQKAEDITSSVGNLDLYWSDGSEVSNAKSYVSEIYVVKVTVPEYETVYSWQPINQPLQSITYAELKTLRDNKQLVSGQQYRITDYQTTTAQSGTTYAGHQFDVIVVADDVDKLNENARAINHPNMLSAMIVDDAENETTYMYQRYPDGDDENGYAWAFNINGENLPFSDMSISDWNDIDSEDLIYTDTLTPSIGDIVDMSGTELPVKDFSDSINLDYFANSKLESWELKYCLDNDTNRFSWAQVSGGTGVIYYMKDEFNNSVYFDFKNIWIYDEDATGLLPFFNDDDYEDMSMFGYANNNIVEGEIIYDETNDVNKLSLKIETIKSNKYVGYQGQIITINGTTTTLQSYLEGL